MHQPSSTKDTDGYLDIFGQLPGLDLYTQMCLCFPLADPDLHQSVIDTLTRGLDRLYASFPWLAGEVVNEGATEGNSGIFKIKGSEKPPRIVVKDLRHDPLVPTMEAFRRSNFPFRTLDENVIAPKMTLVGSSDKSKSEGRPVFVVQVNCITGGLILTFVTHHQTMDMTGQGQVMHLFSKACRDEPFTSEELWSGNVARADLVPLLEDSYQPGSELEFQISKPVPSQPASNVPNDGHVTSSPECIWSCFIFPPHSLISLKALANSTSTAPYVSTDDALTAFIWQSIIRARRPRLDNMAKITLARAVDVRKTIDVPQTYPGLMQNMTFHTYTVEKFLSQPLGAVTSQLRFALDPITSDLKYRTLALATVLARSPDKSQISFVANVEPAKDVMLSSWAKLDCYDLDFNLGLGTPEAVRRPRFDPVEGLIYLMPRRRDGEIVVGICLRNEDLDRLKADEEFAKFATFVG